MTNNSSQKAVYRTISERLGFVRPLYRTLFSRQRAYAAFEEEQLQEILRRLSPKDVILDPMAGYGTLAEICRPLGFKTIGLELNPSSYLWQILRSPDYNSRLRTAVTVLRKHKRAFKTTVVVEASDSWFPPESERLLKKLWAAFSADVATLFSEKVTDDICLAILLPFLSRFSSHSKGIISIHVKKGGMVFYKGIEDDFKCYLDFLEDYLESLDGNNGAKQKAIFGDASTVKFNRKFSYFITSPPYPNMRDYYAFFYPENYAIENIFCVKSFVNAKIRRNIIGGTVVSDYKKENTFIDFDSLVSQSAKKFLISLAEWKGSKRSVSDNISYYIPYYYKYFKEIQSAYINIDKYLEKDAIGYIIVVNNTARKFVIPVCAAVKEIWQSLGRSVSEDEDFTIERSHVGSINPRAVGFKARHVEYAIKIS